MIVCEPDTEHHSNIVDATIKAIRHGESEDERGDVGSKKTVTHFGRAFQ
jgi:hypothetical protein